MLNPAKGHAALRRGRYSSPNAEYFLTLCIEKKFPGLTNPSLAQTIRAQWQKLEASGLWLVRSAVIMPDHLHLFVTLGSDAELSPGIRNFKGPLTPVLRTCQLKWQDSYYDHRLRPNEDLLPLFLYIYLNPYRANLLPATQPYPHYYCHPRDWAWLQSLTHENLPYPEWLRGAQHRGIKPLLQLAGCRRGFTPR